MNPLAKINFKTLQINSSVLPHLNHEQNTTHISQLVFLTNRTRTEVVGCHPDKPERRDGEGGSAIAVRELRGSPPHTAFHTVIERAEDLPGLRSWATDQSKNRGEGTPAGAAMDTHYFLTHRPTPLAQLACNQKHSVRPELFSAETKKQRQKRSFCIISLLAATCRLHNNPSRNQQHPVHLHFRIQPEKGYPSPLPKSELCIISLLAATTAPRNLF